MIFKLHKVLAMGFFALMLTACQKEVLLGDLSESQANEVQAVLLVGGIDTDKSPSKTSKAWEISIDRVDIPRAVSLLRAHGLPRVQNQTMGDIFRKEGFVSSPLEEKARYLYSLSQEMSSTLMEIDGVLSAKVHVALPEKEPFQEKRASASVSVLIIHASGWDLLPFETDIKAIIMDGIEGVTDVNRVTVKFFGRHIPDNLQGS